MWLSIDAGPSLEICSGRMLLQQAPTCGAQRQLTTRFWKKKNHQLFPLNASILAPYISDIQCLKYAASWMQLCLKNHTQCNNSVYGFNSTDILKRFIRVGNGQASVLLRNETHQDERTLPRLFQECFVIANWAHHMYPFRLSRLKASKLVKRDERYFRARKNIRSKRRESL
jgi:hypothetical protein